MSGAFTVIHKIENLGYGSDSALSFLISSL